MSGKKAYTLLQNTSVSGAGTLPINGGDYVWTCEAANWNGATATLQHLMLDGVTWTPVLDSGAVAVTLAANGYKSVGLPQDGIIRVEISVAVPVGMNSNIAGL